MSDTRHEGWFPKMTAEEHEKEALRLDKMAELANFTHKASIRQVAANHRFAAAEARALLGETQ